MDRVEWKPLIAAIAICELAGVIGSLFTAPSIPTWYASLSKPQFSPPNWVFGPVWVTLYAMMGVAAYLIYRSEDRGPLRIFAAQLALNVLWSAVFFGLHSISGALLVIALLWAAIAWTILSFLKASRNAAYLLIPYILWTSFAAVLNYYLWILN